MKNFGKMVFISIIFFLLFLLGFSVVAWKVMDLRYKYKGLDTKFPNKLKSPEDV